MISWNLHIYIQHFKYRFIFWWMWNSLHFKTVFSNWIFIYPTAFYTIMLDECQVQEIPRESDCTIFNWFFCITRQVVILLQYGFSRILDIGQKRNHPENMQSIQPSSSFLMMVGTSLIALHKSCINAISGWLPISTSQRIYILFIIHSH